MDSKVHNHQVQYNNLPDHEPKKHSGFKEMQKQKIQYLHRMLDNQISTVNTLFEKDNAFQQIQSKLRQLQVKLSSIKEDGNPINAQHFQNNSKKNSFCISGLSNADHYSSIKQTDYTPFESLSKYKQTKKSQFKKQQEQKTMSKSKRHMKKQKFDYSESGKKLNFDNDCSLNQQNQDERRRRTKQSGKRMGSNKIRSETKIKVEKRENRSKSTKQRNNLNRNEKSSMKTMTRQNSESNKKMKKESKKTKQRINSSSKKLQASKTTSNLYQWRDIAQIYGRNKQRNENLQSQRKEKVKQIIRQSEAKRLEKQLSDYKLKNQSLQQQVAELKSYKNQFEKLKSIFQKDERIKKSRRKF